MSEPSKRRRTRRMGIEALEERLPLAGDTYLVNFQNDEATTPARYVRDTGELFDARGGGLSYGWTADHTDQGRERSVNADQRFDTLVHFEFGQSWEFALPNGEYEVTVAVGDPQFDDGVHTVNVEGVNLFNAVPDVGGPFVDSVVVSVTDGRLTLDQGARSSRGPPRARGAAGRAPVPAPRSPEGRTGRSRAPRPPRAHGPCRWWRARGRRVERRRVRAAAAPPPGRSPARTPGADPGVPRPGAARSRACAGRPPRRRVPRADAPPPRPRTRTRTRAPRLPARAPGTPPRRPRAAAVLSRAMQRWRDIQIIGIGITGSRPGSGVG